MYTNNKTFYRFFSWVKVCLTLLLVLTSITSGFSQSFFIRNPLEHMGAQPHFSLSGEVYANKKDVLLDFGIGMDDIGYDYTARLNFAFRPYTKRVLSEIEEKEWRQYWERLYIISLDLEKRFNFMIFGDNNRFGPYLATKIAYFLADYRGMSKHPNAGFKFIPSTGLGIQFGHSTYSLGYLFLNNGTDDLNGMLQFKYAYTFYKN